LQPPLGTLCPDLAKQWHPHKNSSLTAFHVTKNSGRRVWWQCKHGHEWPASVNDRSHEIRGTGCPYCSNQTSRPEIRIYCELQSIFGTDSVKWKHRMGRFTCDVFLPTYKIAVEYDGVHWHVSEKKDRLKDHFLAKHGMNVVRVREPGLEPLSQNDIMIKPGEKDLDIIRKLVSNISRDFLLSGEDAERVSKYLKGSRLRNTKGFNEMLSWLPAPPKGESLEHKNHKLAADWDYEKNSPMVPSGFYPYSNKRVWWKCQFGHSWRESINNRSAGTGCPYCAHKRPSPEFNLQNNFPELSEEWHPEKNGDLRPVDVTPGSGKKVWWKGTCGHEWEQRINDRVHGQGCSYCAGKKASPENNIAFKFPKIIEEWHWAKNHGLNPSQITPFSHKKVWWICRKGHEWRMAIIDRTRQVQKCPYCSGRRPSSEYNLAVSHPDLVAEWHPDKNDDLKPTDVTHGSQRKVWWKCKNNPEHVWKAEIKNRTRSRNGRGTGCPKCRMKNWK
jgi:hypothetical protein